MTTGHPLVDGPSSQCGIVGEEGVKPGDQIALHLRDAALWIAGRIADQLHQLDIGHRCDTRAQRLQIAGFEGLDDDRARERQALFAIRSSSRTIVRLR